MNIRAVSAELQKVAQQELHEDPRRLLEDIKNIKDWLKQQHHLKIREEDQHLLTFLRGCKFSLQQTKSKLDFFYSARTLIPELLADKDPSLPSIQSILKTGAVIVLPQKEGQTKATGVLCRYSVCCYETMTVSIFLKVFLMYLDVLLNEDDNMIISGLNIIVDFEDFDSRFMLQFTPTLAKNFFVTLQKAYPIRIKGYYCINVPSTFETMYSIAKPFMTEKLRNRMQVFSKKSINSFYQCIGQVDLPKEYGGQNGSCIQLAADCKLKIEQYRNWFIKDAKYCSNEELRTPVSPFNPSSVLGIEGSFRKLTVD